jgi:hypothetical protein
MPCRFEYYKNKESSRVSNQLFKNKNDPGFLNSMIVVTLGMKARIVWQGLRMKVRSAKSIQIMIVFDRPPFFVWKLEEKSI